MRSLFMIILAFSGPLFAAEADGLSGGCAAQVDARL